MAEITFGVWLLIGAAIVFFMQCGFAMVETGFTRAKNAGNIIMKNLMDFCIGAIVYMLLGAGLLLGEDALAGLIGVPNYGYITNFATYDWSSFVFNLVFCATAATIVSGSMAERTKFASYCIYSAIISLVIYPIEAHWVWGGGWLSKLGFIDFAGSAAIHMVGGISALIGAIMVGPRLGKYTRDANGKVIKVNAIPGHSLPLGALGCFILWFCWYGFNGAAAKSVAQLGQIFGTTTIAPAVATVVCMLFTWIKNKKPDVSMCLNASLAGLVAVTAGCTNVDAIGATIIGAVSGFLVVGVVELLDLKLHIDDPVGAVAVHCANGMWGTIAAGLFATSTSAGGVDGPIYALIHGTSFVEGLRVFGVQIAGLVAIAAWTTATMTLTFFIIKKTIGLRVTKEEEIVGLDRTEHGLPSAYADFPITVHDYDALPVTFIDVVPSTQGAVNSEAAVSVERKDLAEPKKTGEPKLTKVEIICRERMLEPLKNAMVDIGITGMTVTHVMGCGAQKGKPEYYRGVEIEPSLLPKVQLEMVVSKVPVRDVIETAKKVLYTGHIGDGKIFVYDVENAVKVRTGEEGYDALQDVE
ncbi:MAG: ammonium transporter [Firmicutes bacterium]|nr:ammonium transporter [Bacillota bacterium]